MTVRKLCPSDLEQRSGRIVRQGNQNPEVHIYRYVTEGTFDSYLYQLVENKQRFIGQIMTSKSPVRSAEDIDETALSYAEIKALATGDPHIKEKMDLDMQAAKLKIVRGNFLDHKYALEDRLAKGFPLQIAKYEEQIAGYESDIARLAANSPVGKDAFGPMDIKGTQYFEAKEAGEALLDAIKGTVDFGFSPVGKYFGFDMAVSFDSFEKNHVMMLIGAMRHRLELGTDARGNITRIDNFLSSLPDKLRSSREHLDNIHTQTENAKSEIAKTFPQEEELKRIEARLSELNAMLNMDEKGRDASDLDAEPEEDPKIHVREAERER